MNLLRKGIVLANGQVAGTISEYVDLQTEKFVFEYAPSYLENGSPIGYHYPLNNEPYISDHLPTFFSNLVSEGWLLRQQSKNMNISKDDFFGLLLANGRDLIGAISVIPENNE